MSATKETPRERTERSASMLNQALDNAQQALASGDVVAILQAYERLKECQ